MSTRISHLPEILRVTDEIELRAKNIDGLVAFKKIASANRDHLFNWMPWAENTPDESSVEHYVNAPARRANNEAADWDIVVQGNMCGAVGLFTRDAENPILEIGYWLAQDAQGKGVITQSVQAVTDLAFEETDTPFVEIGCDAANTKSAAVALRCAYNLHREQPTDFSNGRALLETETAHFYRLTREQWLAR